MTMNSALFNQNVVITSKSIIQWSIPMIQSRKTKCDSIHWHQHWCLLCPTLQWFLGFSPTRYCVLLEQNFRPSEADNFVLQLCLVNQRPPTGGAFDQSRGYKMCIVGVVPKLHLYKTQLQRYFQRCKSLGRRQTPEHGKYKACWETLD